MANTNGQQQATEIPESELGYSRSDFVPHPAGIWKAVFSAYKGVVHPEYGKQVDLTFKSEAKMDDGQPFSISAWTKPSLHPKGRIAKLLAAQGVDAARFTDEEVKAFSLKAYLNKKVLLVVEHEKKPDGTVRAKITSILPFKKDAPTGPAASSEVAAAGAAAGAGDETEIDWDA
jgi:hypothetical protein